MSVKFMAAVWDLALTQSEAWVLMAYADHADHQGRNIKAGIELIAYKTGFSERQVQRITHKLAADKILVAQTPGNGRGKVAEWRIDLDAAPRKGDMVSPFPPTDEPERVTPEPERVTQRVTSEALKGDTAMSPEPVNRVNQPEPRDKTTTALSARARESDQPAAAAALTLEQQVAVRFLLEACPDFAGPVGTVRAHPPALVAAWATYAARVMTHAKRDRIKSLSGYLVRNIQAGELPVLPDDEARRFADHVAFARSGVWPSDSPWQPAPEDAEDFEPEYADEPPVVERDHTWEVTRSQLRLQMTPSTFNTWLRDTEAVRNGDTLIVTVASQNALDWIVFRLKTIITRTVRSIDQTVQEIEFQVAAPTAA